MSALRLRTVIIIAGVASCGRYVTVGHEDQLQGMGGSSAGTAAAGTAAQGGAGSGGTGGAPGSAGAAGASGVEGGGASGQAGAGALLPWLADHDDGTLDEWLGDGSGWQYIEGNATLELSTERAHSGDHALLVSIDTQSGEQTQAVLARDLELEDGRYGAWYFLPEAPTADFWVIMKLSNGRDIDRFDVDIEAPAGGEPHLRLYEHDLGYITDPAPTVVPVGQWFHVEALYRSTAASDGRLVVLQDGVTVLDTGPRSTASDAHVSWIVGSSSRYVAPSPYRLFIDDANVSVGSGL